MFWVVQLVYINFSRCWPLGSKSQVGATGLLTHRRVMVSQLQLPRMSMGCPPRSSRSLGGCGQVRHIIGDMVVLEFFKTAAPCSKLASFLAGRDALKLTLRLVSVSVIPPNANGLVIARQPSPVKPKLKPKIGRCDNDANIEPANVVFVASGAAGTAFLSQIKLVSLDALQDAFKPT